MESTKRRDFVNSILERIGNAPMLQLNGVVPEGHARVLIKLESENPTGSMKDRMALAMIDAAERDGRLQPGGNVIEYTGGVEGANDNEVGLRGGEVGELFEGGGAAVVVNFDVFNEGGRGAAGADGAIFAVEELDGLFHFFFSVK